MNYLFKVSIRIEEERYGNWETEDRFIGIFSTEEKALSVGTDALKKILVSKIDDKRFYGLAHFRNSEYSIEIETLVLDQRYDGK